MITQKNKILLRHILYFLLALVMVFGIGQYAVPAANAGAVSSFNLYVTDKGGADQLVGTWSYDSANKTFRDGNGTEAPFVKTFSGNDVLYYSGKDNYIAPRMAVCTRGILFSDLKTYVANATGIPLNDNVTVKWGMANLGWSYPYSFITDRYYYPSYIMGGFFENSGKVEVPAVLAITSYNQRNTNQDKGWTSAETVATLGEIVPLVTDEATLNYAFGVLTAHADDDRSLRVLLGQRAESPNDLNLGQLSLYNAGCAGFVPIYLDIDASVTNNDGSAATGAVNFDDGYAKAAAGEAVSFTVSGITSGYGVDTVSVTDGSSGAVNVSETGGVYSFTMPDSAVTLDVSLKAVQGLCTVTFVSDGATYTAVSAEPGSTIAAPAAPAKEGFTFDGWYADEAWTTPVSFPYTVTGDTTLYARWIPHYTVTFVSDGATYTTVSAALGSTIDKPSPPAKSGSTFGGWYTDEAFTTAAVFPYTVSGDTTLYAKWTAFAFNYTISGGKATITGYTGSGGDVVIPGTITDNGTDYPVTAIGSTSFQNKTALTSVTIPDSVTKLGSASFRGCTGLSSLVIPSSVTTPGNGAFENCTGLTSVTISNTVIGQNMFKGCSGLTSVTIADGVTSIGDTAFLYCTGLTSVSIPASVISLSGSAFAGCSNLTTVNIDPDNTAYASGAAGVVLNKAGTVFVLCPNGKSGSYNIPDGITQISDYAFGYCAGLTSITIPSGVTSIGANAFRNCSGLTSMTIPNGVTILGNNAFTSCGNLANIAIPDSVTSIGSGAFNSCSSLTSVTIPAGVTSGLGNNAFSLCPSLASVYFKGAMSSELTVAKAFTNNQSPNLVIYYHVSQSSSWSGFTAYTAKPFSGLTVDLNDGSALASSKEVVTDGHIAAPADPAREGYTFGGWYKEAACVNAFDFGSETVTGDVTVYAKWTAGLADGPRYTVTPVSDQSVYEVGETGGISAMTVKAGVNGLKYFGTLIAPVIEHEGKEAVVFVHLRNGVQLSINVTRADFDLVGEAQSGFNVEAGDVVKVFIVDDLTNDTNFNPTILQ